MPFTIPAADMFGEVFICPFPFTSGASGKVRPALVHFNLQQDAVICRITSANRTGVLDVPLNDWQTAFETKIRVHTGGMPVPPELSRLTRFPRSSGCLKFGFQKI